MIKRVSYLQSIGKKEMHELIYRLQERNYLVNDFILRKQEDTTEMFLLVSGTVHYVTEIDGHDFVLKELEAGSIINPTNVIIDDLMWVDIKCTSNVKMMVLSNENLMIVANMFQSMKTKINNAWSNIDRFGNKFPLDFIESQQTKSSLTPQEVETDQKNGKIIRRNIFKNIVYRKLIHVRYLKSLPKLFEFIAKFK